MFSGRDHALKWAGALKSSCEELNLHVYNTEDDGEGNEDIPWEEIGFAIVWKPPKGLLDRVRAVLPLPCASHPEYFPAVGIPGLPTDSPCIMSYLTPIQCSNLKAVQLTGAGVDSVLSQGLVPTSLPIGRIVDPIMSQSMAMYILCAVLNLHRKTEDYQVCMGSHVVTEGLPRRCLPMRSQTR